MTWLGYTLIVLGTISVVVGFGLEEWSKEKYATYDESEARSRTGSKFTNFGWFFIMAGLAVVVFSWFYNLAN